MKRLCTLAVAGALLAIATTAQAADTWSTPYTGVRHLFRTASGPLRINAVVIDLCAAGISVRATASGERKRTVSSFGNLVNAEVAVNADFFSFSTYATSGLSIGNGQRWTDTADGAGSGFVAFGSSNAIFSPTSDVVNPPPSWMKEVVSGHPDIVRNGQVINHGDQSKHPRTAAGFSKDRRTLYLMVIDGRSSSSVGATFVTLGQQIQSIGAYDAVNLDGGGSTTMWIRSKGVVNAPSDGSQRVVANHLAIRAKGSGTPTSCTPLCACTAGQVQTEACGNCGTRTRTCGSDCQWQSWSACHGQGPCSPGSVETRDCCDCGTQSRSCAANCTWSSYGACAGPDPAEGTQSCETGEPGPCAAGLMRCIEGCLNCRRTYEPVPEICDAIDNDCSGEVDDGEPSEMGDPPPEWAARLMDVGFPATLDPGARATGWVVFKNEGSRTWEMGDLWLEATSSWDGARSPLNDVDAWPAYGVVAVLAETVRPGEQVMLNLPLKVPGDAEGHVRERFHLVDYRGSALRCPAVQFEVSVLTKRTHDDSPSQDMDPSTPEVSSSSGCAMSPGPRNFGWIGLILLGGLLYCHRLRDDRRGWYR